MQQLGSKTEQYQVEVHSIPDTNQYVPRIIVTQHGMENYIPMNVEFFYSKDYKELVNLGAKLASLVEEGAYIKRGDKEIVVENFEQALNWLMEEAKKARPYNAIKVWER